MHQQLANLNFESYEIEYLKNIFKSFIEFLIVMLLKFLNGLIHFFWCNLGLNLLYINITNDPKCLRK